MKTGIIYKAVSPSGKIYIGQTKFSLNYRKTNHEYMANKRNLQTKFANAIRKYKDELKWEVLYKDIPEDMLDIAEMCAIYIYDSYENGYNSTLGGMIILQIIQMLIVKERLNKLVVAIPCTENM